MQRLVNLDLQRVRSFIDASLQEITVGELKVIILLEVKCGISNNLKNVFGFDNSSAFIKLVTITT